MFTPDQFKRRRRDRRMARTAHSEAEIRAWAELRGLSLRVLNDGHLCFFQKTGFMAEWWPSSGNLALNRQYLGSIQAPHWPQVAAAIEAALTRETQPR